MRISNNLSVTDYQPNTDSRSVMWGLTGIRDWRDCPFLDIAKAARGFDSANQDVDAQGNLSNLSGTGLTRQFFIASAPIDHSYRDGDYTIFWDGGSGVVFDDRTGVTLNSASANQASVTIAFGTSVFFEFENIDSSDPLLM